MAKRSQDVEHIATGNRKCQLNSHLWVLWENVVHQSLVAGPQSPTATTHPFRREGRRYKEWVSERVRDDRKTYELINHVCNCRYLTMINHQ